MLKGIHLYTLTILLVISILKMREGFKVDKSYVDIKMKLLDRHGVSDTYHEEIERNGK